MHRLSLVFAGAVTCAVLAFGGTAAAKPAPKTCATTSHNVIGGKVAGTLTASNVNSVQKEFATCDHARKVMNRVTAYRYEEPKSVAGFWCTPRVLATSPDVVKYNCTFKGADTAMMVKLVFRVKYDLD
jgi:hypothetical protein